MKRKKYEIFGGKIYQVVADDLDVGDYLVDQRLNVAWKIQIEIWSRLSMEDSQKGMAHYSVPPKIRYFIPLGQKSKSKVALKFSFYFLIVYAWKMQ